jgi:transcriptional regulator with XRE-family HTH domain
METIRTSVELEELLGSRLRELRLLKNLDQRSLAERACLSKRGKTPGIRQGRARQLPHKITAGSGAD